MRLLLFLASGLVAPFNARPPFMTLSLSYLQMRLYASGLQAFKLIVFAAVSDSMAMSTVIPLVPVEDLTYNTWR